MYQDQFEEERETLRGITENEFLTWNLIRAETHAQQALNELYKPGATKRRFFYRWALGRAQAILIKLVAKELGTGNR